MFCDSIGVVGAGTVGSALVRGFSEYSKEIRVYDIDQRKRTHSPEEVFSCDFVFVCLPTPMDENGKCDLSVIDTVFSIAQSIVGHEEMNFILRSTVPVGTTAKYSEKFSRIIHSPEFLTARCAGIDFCFPSRNVIGVTKNPKSHRLAGRLSELYRKRFPGVDEYIMDSSESELCKLTCNSFFATKVSFFNEIYSLCEKLRINFSNVLAGALSDGRIANSHFRVPGPDGQRGFGGACYCKDINDLISVFNENGVEQNVISAAWKTNLSVRENKDWLKNKSAYSGKISDEVRSEQEDEWSNK